MTALSYVAIYGVLIILASLLGGWLPSLVVLTHQRMQLMVSAVAGLMLGVAFLNLLPHAAVFLQSFDRALGWTITGLLTMFLMIRTFHTHQHGVREPAGVTAELPDCGHRHQDQESVQPARLRGFSWMGIAAGLSLHTLIDGIALAAAVESETLLADSGGYPGLGTFLAVALHKPLDSLAITSLMASQGWSRRWQQAINFVYSLMCPIGAALFVLGISKLGHDASPAVGAALAFAAGVFLCIALADLLPEVEFHSHNRLSLSTALLAGVALAYVLGFVEPHRHPHDHDEHEHGRHRDDGHQDHSHSHSDQKR